MYYASITFICPRLCSIYFLYREHKTNKPPTDLRRTYSTLSAKCNHQDKKGALNLLLTTFREHGGYNYFLLTQGESIKGNLEAKNKEPDYLHVRSVISLYSQPAGFIPINTEVMCNNASLLHSVY